MLVGAAIVEGGVYSGSGYTHLGPFLPFTSGQTFYAFPLKRVPAERRSR
jgi:hypothetical protein